MFLRPGSLLFSAFYNIKFFKAQWDAYWGETPTRSLGCLFCAAAKKAHYTWQVLSFERWNSFRGVSGVENDSGKLLCFTQTLQYVNKDGVESSRATTKKKKCDFSWNHTKEERHLDVSVASAAGWTLPHEDFRVVQCWLTLWETFQRKCRLDVIQ